MFLEQSPRNLGQQVTRGDQRFSAFSISTKEAAFFRPALRVTCLQIAEDLPMLISSSVQCISNEIKLKGLQCLRKFLNSRGIICKGREMGEMVSAAAFCLISSSLLRQTGERQREVLPAGKLHWKMLKKTSDLPQKI